MHECFYFTLRNTVLYKCHLSFLIFQTTAILFKLNCKSCHVSTPFYLMHLLDSTAPNILNITSDCCINEKTGIAPLMVSNSILMSRVAGYCFVFELVQLFTQ